MAHSHRKRVDDILRDQFAQGYNAGIESTFKVIYCSILVGAHKVYGFGRKRGMRLLKMVDKIVTDGLYIDGQEAVEQLQKDYGFTLSFYHSDPFDQEIVKEADTNAKP